MNSPTTSPTRQLVLQVAKKRAKEQKARAAEREARASFDSEKQGMGGTEGEVGQESEEVEASKDDDTPVDKSKISTLGGGKGDDGSAGKVTDDSDVASPQPAKSPSQSEADAAWEEKKRFQATEVSGAG